MSTLTVLVLLFGYHTSTEGAAATVTVAASSAVAGSTPTSSATPSTSATPSSSATATGPSADSGSVTTDGTGTTGSGTASSSPTTAPTTTTTTAAAAAGTFTGTAASTRYGPVQVEITVAGGKVTAVDVVEYPTGNGKDQEINSRAVPTLVQETLDAQSASIDMVSGATYTSDGYLQSLQSALDQAGL